MNNASEVSEEEEEMEDRTQEIQQPKLRKNKLKRYLRIDSDHD